ncbi:Tppp [Symbiodinium sp. KB8]|nr:Tppp [Symbiodinium sp. KB8]
MADPRASAGPRSAEIEALEASIRAISEGDEAASATAASAGPDDAPHAGTGGDYSHSPGRRGPVDCPAAASARGSPAPEGAKRLLSREELFEIFDFYCNYGRSMVQDYQESLDSFMFMKFARECPQLLSGSVNRTAIDLIFAKAKPKFERRLDFDHFLDALSAIAEKKFPDYPPRDGLRLLLAQHLVPHHELVRHEMLKTGETERFRTGDGRINGDTEARSGRSFRGSTNTGTNETVHDISSLMRPHLHGGGTMMSPVNHSSFRVKKRRDLAAAGAGAAAASSGRSKSPGAANKAAIAEMERALSAAREGKHEEAAEAAAAGDGDEDALSAYGEYVDDEEDLEDPVPEPTDEFLAELRGTAPPLDQTAIKEIFLFYSNFGRSRAQDYQESLDSFMFMKFARECPHLLDGRVLNRTSVDLIFTKAKAKGERRLSFSHFLDALSAMAEKKYEMFSAPDRFRSGDGRINGDTDARAGRSFRGSTNTGTDETIHDISSLMRPNLRSGTMMRSRAKSFGGSPRRRPQSARAAAGPSDRLLAPTASTQAKAVDGDGTPRSRGWH